MLVLTFLGSVLAGSTDHSAAFERFLDATTAARGTPMCLNPLVEDMHEHRSEMSVAERAEVDAFLGPAAAPTSVPLRTRGARFVDAPLPPSTGSQRTTCVPIAEEWGANQLVGERFTIAWDDGATESQAEDLMEAFDKSYEREVGELGWKEPTGMDAFNLWVYIAEDDTYSGAYTELDSCPDREDMPYVVVYSGAFYEGNNRYQDVAAHELNHASQVGYGLYDTYDLWWWEATATWMMEYVYSHNYWSPFTYGFGAWPEIGMHASGRDSEAVEYHMYGMSVWAFYLDEHVGGPDLVRDTWEYLLSHSPGVATMPEVLPDMGVDFDQTYEGFLAATAVMDFEDHDWFYPATLTQDMTELPHTGTPSGSLPQGLGQNFFRIDRSTNPDGKDVQVTFTSEEDVDWYVVLVTTSDSSSVKQYIAATQNEETGDWVAQLPWDGAGDAYMIVSPKSADLDVDYEYQYTVALLEPPAPVDTGDTDIDTSKRDDPSEKSKGICASAGGPASFLFAALGAFAARRRRVTSRA